MDTSGIHILFGQPEVNEADFVETTVGVEEFGSVSDDQVVQLEVIIDIA